MPAHLDGIFWLILSLGPLLILQRSLHREIQTVFLLLTRRADIAITLFSVLFFPGVFLHEGSHYLLARVLGVRTGRFSLIPRPIDGGKLQLGYVETVQTDWVRDSLIGIAPLLSGGAFVAYVGLVQLRLVGLGQALWNEGPQGFYRSLHALIAQPDFWLWLYLALVVSSTMLPSESDRRAWLPLGITLLFLLGASLVFGAGPWLMENLALPFNRVLRAVSLVLGISAILHLVFLPLVWLVRRALGRLLGLEVVL